MASLFTWLWSLAVAEDIIYLENNSCHEITECWQWFLCSFFVAMLLFSVPPGIGFVTPVTLSTHCARTIGQGSK